MYNKSIILLLSFILGAGVSMVDADMVILKSGEMFQTRRAWKANGVVNYYKNNRVVSVDEGQVERLIHAAAPVEETPPPVLRPPAGLSPPPNSSAVGHPPLPVDGDAGYLGLKWGQVLSQVDGLAPAGTDPAYGGVQQFTRTKRKPRFGRASVDDIVYGFWQGGLYTITVWTSNFMDFSDLKAEAVRRFGEGIQNREGVESYHWIDAGTDRMLSYDYDADTGYLWMRSRALHEKVKARYPD